MQGANPLISQNILKFKENYIIDIKKAYYLKFKEINLITFLFYL